MTTPFDRINSAFVKFLDTGDTIQLQTRPGSVNHFFPRFPVGEDDVQLRLDWGDPDANGQPSLDADFIDRQTGKHRRSLTGARKKAHHTPATGGTDRNYGWEFKGLRREFVVTIVWQLDFDAELSFVGGLSGKVRRSRKAWLVAISLLALLLIVVYLN